MQRDRPDPVTNPPVQNIKRLLFGVVVAAPKKRLVYFFCFFFFYFWGETDQNLFLIILQSVSQSVIQARDIVPQCRAMDCDE